jgi:hypothetical protein
MSQSISSACREVSERILFFSRHPERVEECCILDWRLANLAGRPSGNGSIAAEHGIGLMHRKRLASFRPALDRQMTK